VQIALKEDWAEVKVMDTGKLVVVVIKVQVLDLGTPFVQVLREGKCLCTENFLKEDSIELVFKPI
jgi:hypothetical protein